MKNRIDKSLEQQIQKLKRHSILKDLFGRDSTISNNLPFIRNSIFKPINSRGSSQFITLGSSLSNNEIRLPKENLPKKSKLRKRLTFRQSLIKFKEKEIRQNYLIPLDSLQQQQLKEPKDELLLTSSNSKKVIKAGKKSPKSKKKTKNKSKDQTCNCKKTKCLKLYCNCFLKKAFCTEKCKCKGCFNISKHKELRDLIIKQTIEKNPLSFTSKYKTIEGKNKKLNSRGCNCQKTKCQKNYCDCFSQGIGCSEIC